MYPAMKLLLVCVALAACQNQSKLDTAARAVPMLATAPPAADLEARVDRIERRLDKVIAVLDQALPSEPDPDATYSVAIDLVDPVQGPSDAKVTIVEGFEFLCPYCYMVNPTVDEILQKYPKDVRLVSKYLLIHGEPAIAPGMLACAAAKQGKFKEIKAALWSHLFKLEDDRPTVQPDQLAPDNLVKIATDAGLDATKLKADMDGIDCRGWIQSSDASLHPVGASGTPAFFINGRYINGAQPIEAFDAIIKEELAKADKAIADGVAPADYYKREIVAKGITRVKGRFED